MDAKLVVLLKNYCFLIGLASTNCLNKTVYHLTQSIQKLMEINATSLEDFLD